MVTFSTSFKNTVTKVICEIFRGKGRISKLWELPLDPSHCLVPSLGGALGLLSLDFYRLHPLVLETSSAPITGGSLWELNVLTVVGILSPVLTVPNFHTISY